MDSAFLTAELFFGSFREYVVPDLVEHCMNFCIVDVDRTDDEIADIMVAIG